MHIQGTTLRACEYCGALFSPRRSRSTATGYSRFCGRGCSYNGQSIPTPALFLAQVTTGDACWLFGRFPRSDRYGAIWIRSLGRKILAHRYAWELASGETLTDEDVICHTCDVRPCVRNDDPGIYIIKGIEYPRWGHLVKGTNAANNADKAQKSRSNVPGIQGAKHYRAKLTDADVYQIRRCLSQGMTLASIAAHYDVGISTIHHIKQGIRWKHLS